MAKSLAIFRRFSHQRSLFHHPVRAANLIPNNQGFAKTRSSMATTALYVNPEE
jgi:hypothetical protein